MEEYEADDFELLWVVTSGPRPTYDGVVLEVVRRGIERDGKTWTVEDIDQLERERDDYKERWETLGRVSKKVIDRLRSENRDLLSKACAHLREATYMERGTGRARHISGFRAAADELERTFGRSAPEESQDD